MSIDKELKSKVISDIMDNKVKRLGNLYGVEVSDNTVIRSAENLYHFAVDIIRALWSSHKQSLQFETDSTELHQRLTADWTRLAHTAMLNACRDIGISEENARQLIEAIKAEPDPPSRA